jgi:hypothetical protein
MVTYFNRKDLVSFGNYLLSEERKTRFEQIESETPVEERLKQVSHADVENWIESPKD